MRNDKCGTGTRFHQLELPAAHEHNKLLCSESVVGRAGLFRFVLNLTVDGNEF